MKSVCQSEMSIIQLMDKDINEEEENCRVFDYALNKKRAKSKLLKGAKRENLHVESRSGCVNLKFCDGAFYEIVLPLIKDLKVDEVIKINETEVKIIEVHAGVENSENHVDTKLVVLVNGDRLVLHAYNGTQNLMVQGKNYEKFAIDCLKPYFLQRIKNSLDKIQNFNNMVKDTLDVKKPAKIKSVKPHRCPQCDLKLSTIGDLRLHMKKCHTKPYLNSPKKTKALKTSKENIKPLTFETPNTHKNISDMKINHPLIIPEVEDLLSCNICDFDTDSISELKNHMEILHGQNIEQSNSEDSKVKSIQIQNTDVQEVHSVISETKNSLVETTIICGECGKGNINEEQYNSHMAGHVTLLDIKCEKCDFVTVNQDEIKAHMQTTHSLIKVDLKIEDQNVISCDECDYKCRLNIQYKRHKKDKHIDKDGKYACNECDYTTNFIGIAWEHTMKVHINPTQEFNPKDSKNLVLNMVAEQTTSIVEELENLKKEAKNTSREFENLKKDTKNTFHEFAKALEVCIEKLNDNTNDKCKALGNTIDKLCDKVTKLEESFTKNSITNEKLITDKIEEKKVSAHNHDSKKTYASALSSPNVTVPPPPSTTSQQPRSRYLSQPKVLFAGDSIAQAANLRKIEKSRKCRIRSVRAYSSVHDNLAKFPTMNFEDVIADNLENPGRESYDILMMSSPTVDITNTDTKDKMEEKAVQSSKNMMYIAEQALARKSGSLKQVIIMEHPPRFDGVRSHLAQVANSALKHLHLKSPSKDRIVIGQHSLESSGVGPTHQARYQDYHTGRYDGVHLYGRTGAKDYTDSVNTMLLMALPETRTTVEQTQFTDVVRDNNPSASDHTRCEQAVYQWRQAQRRRSYRQASYAAQQRYSSHSTHYTRDGVPQWSIPVANRFTLFNQGN